MVGLVWFLPSISILFLPQELIHYRKIHNLEGRKCQIIQFGTQDIFAKLIDKYILFENGDQGVRKSKLVYFSYKNR